MAYLKPPAFTRHLANPLAMRLSARGVAMVLDGWRSGGWRRLKRRPLATIGDSCVTPRPGGGQHGRQNPQDQLRRELLSH